MKELENKKVIIVGPSSYLENRKMGNFIDSYDIVVRINNLHDTTNSQLVDDFGKQTDLIYYDGSTTNTRLQSYIDCNPLEIICTYPETEWFFKSRCANNVNTFHSHLNGRVIDEELYTDLKYDLDNNMKTRPNSGLIAIVDLLTFPIAELYITGIDFYRNSYSTYHPDYGKTELESIKEIFKKGDAGDVHDINKQFMYFKNLFHNESRLKTDDIMLNYITNKKYENVSF